MCGIGGILFRAPLYLPPALAKKREDAAALIDSAISHRGPDGLGRFDASYPSSQQSLHITLLHRRLSIIDIDGGAQPMTARAGAAAVSIVFNGCIYNHRHLRSALEARGVRFSSSHSDTEVICQGLLLDGPEFIRKLDGMFAIAACFIGPAVQSSSPQPSFLLARDSHGEKPLYASLGDESLIFASSAAAVIRASPAFFDSRSLPSAASLASYLAMGWDINVTAPTKPAPAHGFHELPPASIYIWDADLNLTRTSLGRAATHPSSSTRASSTDKPFDPKTLLSTAVASRLEADVPLGCFLSGGIDSSLIAAFAQQSQPRGTRLRTFCMRMPEQDFDESAVAQSVAEHLGTDHTTLECNPTAAEDLVSLIERLGVPFGDSSLLPTYWLAAACRKHIKVALSGDGGDELFCGYRRHSAARYLNRYSFLLKLCPEQASSLLSGTRFDTAARFLAAAHAGYPQLPAIFLRKQAIKLMGELGTEPFAAAPLGQQQANHWDLAHYLPSDLMRKVDTASMAVGLEVRAPFLEPALVHAAASHPMASLMPHGQRKGLLKALALTMLPRAVVDRPKHGFSIPLDLWFRSNFGGLRDLLFDLLESSDPFPTNVLGFEVDRRFVRRLVVEHMQQGRNHGQRMYILLVLAVWSRWVGSLQTPGR